MGGSTKKVSTIPQDITGLRQGVVSYLAGNNGPQSIPQKGSQLGNGWTATGAPIGLPAGPMSQGQGSPFDRINAGLPPDPGRVEVQRPNDIGPLAQVGGGGPIRDVSAERVGSGLNDQLSQLMASLGTDRGMIRDVRASGVTGFGGGGAGGPMGQSLDQIGGANSDFFKNMMAQLQPAFTQQRAMGLAQAKEAAGNLSGSGLANYLGASVNRSLGDEQARLADYAFQGVLAESQRQQQAAAAAQSGMNNAANLDLQAQLANQGMDLNYMNYLLNRGQFGLQGAQLGLQAEGMNQEAALRAGLANQQGDVQRGQLGQQGQMFNTQYDFLRQQANQGNAWNANNLQAQLDQQRNMGIYGAQNQNAQQNAQNYLQLLLGMSTTGVGPDQVVQKGGIGQMLPGLLGIGGQLLGAKLGGGGGSGSVPNYGGGGSSPVGTQLPPSGTYGSQAFPGMGIQNVDPALAGRGGNPNLSSMLMTSGQPGMMAQPGLMQAGIPQQPMASDYLSQILMQSGGLAMPGRF